MYLPSHQFVEQAQPVRPWTETLSHGDIVSFRFPIADENGAAPKARPCLVLDIEEREGLHLVTLAYGTSAEGRANRGYEIRVACPEDAAAAGLDRPTRFVGARRLIVSLAHPGFHVSRSLGTPVIGRLPGIALARMHRVRARIHAERDIAAFHAVRRAKKRNEEQLCFTTPLPPRRQRA